MVKTYPDGPAGTRSGREGISLAAGLEAAREHPCAGATGWPPAPPAAQGAAPVPGSGVVGLIGRRAVRLAEMVVITNGIRAGRRTAFADHGHCAHQADPVIGGYCADTCGGPVVVLRMDRD